MSYNDTAILRATQELREKFKNSSINFKQHIEDLEKRARQGIMRVKLYDEPEIKKLVHDMAATVNMIDATLSSDEKYLNDEGKKLLDRKKMYEGFIQIFVKSPEQLESISREIDEIVKANS